MTAWVALATPAIACGLPQANDGAYEIRTADEFDAIGTNGCSVTDAYVVMNDIDFRTLSHPYTPPPSAFGGSLRGSVEQPDVPALHSLDLSTAGPLLGDVDADTVVSFQRLALVDVTFVSTSNASFGVLAGSADGGPNGSVSLVDVVLSDVDVSASSQGFVGALFGSTKTGPVVIDGLRMQGVHVSSTAMGVSLGVGNVGFASDVSALSVSDVWIGPRSSVVGVGPHVNGVAALAGAVSVDYAVTDVRFEGTVSGGDLYTGGLVGTADGGVFERVAVTETAVVSGLGTLGVGGILGQVEPPTVVRDSFVRARIDGGTRGGLIGQYFGGTYEGPLSVTDAYAVPAFSGGCTGSCGAFLGEADGDQDSSVHFVDAVWDATETSVVSAVGTVTDGIVSGTAVSATTASATSVAFYDGGIVNWSIADESDPASYDGNAVWGIDDGNAYPILLANRPLDVPDLPVIEATPIPPTTPPTVPASSVMLSLTDTTLAVQRNVPFSLPLVALDGDGEVVALEEASSLSVRVEGESAGALVDLSDGATEGAAPTRSFEAGAEALPVGDLVYVGSPTDGTPITLVVSGVDGSLSGSVVSLTDLEVAPTTFALDVGAGEALADGSAGVTATAAFLDASGDGIPGIAVAFDTDLGTLVVSETELGASTTQTTDANGEASVGLASDGAGVATLQAACPGDCTVEADVAFTGAPSDVSVDVASGTGWVSFQPLPEAVTAVTYEVRQGGELVAGSPVTLSGSDAAPPIRIGGLEDGASYAVTLFGSTEDGDLPASEAVAFTPEAAEAPPVTAPREVTEDDVEVIENEDGSVDVNVTTGFTNTSGGTIERVWLMSDPAATLEAAGIEVAQDAQPRIIEFVTERGDVTELTYEGNQVWLWKGVGLEEAEEALFEVLVRIEEATQ